MSSPQLFDPHDFFRFAAQTLSSTRGEAESRTAIGRAYYACYLIAVNRMFGVDGARMGKKVRKSLVRRGGLHEVVKVAIGQNRAFSSGQQITIRDMFAQLRDLRIQADYKTDTSGEPSKFFAQYRVGDWSGLAHAALALASQLLPTLRRLRRHA